MTALGIEPDEFDDDYDDEESLLDEAALSCGRMMMAGERSCTMAGTEWCDFDCPFRDEARQRRRKPRPAPLLDFIEKKT